MVSNLASVLFVFLAIAWVGWSASNKDQHNLRIRSKTSPITHVLNKYALKEAVKEKIKDYDAAKVPQSKRVLSIYHVGVTSLDFSVDVVVNNIKIFSAAVHSHVDATHVEGLYLFNLVNGESNPYFKYVPCDLSNVVCVHLDHESTEFEQIVDMETHKDITDILSTDLLLKFKSVFFLNHEARGPFVKARNGEWLNIFAQLIDQPNALHSTSKKSEHSYEMSSVEDLYKYRTTKNIGAVSVGISCEPVPRLLTHAFMLSSSLVSKVFAAVALHSVEESQYHNRTDQLGAALTTHLLRSGVSIASIVQQSKLSAAHTATDASKSSSSTGTHHKDRDEHKLDHNLFDHNGQGNLLDGAFFDHNLERDGRHLTSKSSKPKALSSTEINNAIYDNKCLVSYCNEKYTTNPLLWCNLQPSDIVFVRFGGALLKTPGIMCEDAIKSISAATSLIALADPALKLHVPEAVYGGPYRELYRQYSVQEWRWQQPSQNTHLLPKPAPKKSFYSYGLGQKHKDSDAQGVMLASTEPLVCFLVRSASVHSLKANGSEPPSSLVKMDITLLINTLVKQVNPHWRAYFFVTDDNPFETELKSILKGHKDSRLEFLDVPLEFRPSFTSTDAGYTATDFALTSLFSKPDCKWISVSNADNAYGTHVVENVLKVRDDPVTGVPPSMVLAPLDSRNLAEQDYIMRAALKGGKTGGWRERCVGVETSLKLHLFVYTIQSLPLVGRVDLAAVFLDVHKLKQENLFFSNFSDVSKYSCKGCQDGYLTETLVTQRFWSYVQLPIDGLRSMVFHGPSPTLCIASGNVWFDFPEVNKLGCVSHRTIGDLYPSPFYDFTRFHDPRSPRVCLRLSQKGFWNRTASVIT